VNSEMKYGKGHTEGRTMPSQYDLMSFTTYEMEKTSV